MMTDRDKLIDMLSRANAGYVEERSIGNYVTLIEFGVTFYFDALDQCVIVDDGGFC